MGDFVSVWIEICIKNDHRRSQGSTGIFCFFSDLDMSKKRPQEEAPDGSQQRIWISFAYSLHQNWTRNDHRRRHASHERIWISFEPKLNKPRPQEEARQPGEDLDQCCIRIEQESTTGGGNLEPPTFGSEKELKFRNPEPPETPSFFWNLWILIP